MCKFKVTLVGGAARSLNCPINLIEFFVTIMIIWWRIKYKCFYYFGNVCFKRKWYVFLVNIEEYCNRADHVGFIEVYDIDYYGMATLHSLLMYSLPLKCCCCCPVFNTYQVLSRVQPWHNNCINNNQCLMCMKYKLYKFRYCVCVYRVNGTKQLLFSRSPKHTHTHTHDDDGDMTEVVNNIW